MRGLLARATLQAVSAALTVVGVPVLLFLLWFGLAGGASHADVARALAGPTGASLAVALFLGLVGLAAAAAYLVARRNGARLSGPLRDLSRQAKLLGQEAMTPMRSGVPEVDELSALLCRSSQELTVMLSRERTVVADASHQLRTPLTAVLIRLEEIAALDDVDAIHREAEDSIEQVERLTRIVEDLLSRSRLASDPVRVSLDTVIAGLQRQWQPAFERARRSVRVSGERGVSVAAAPVSVSEILATLLDNSLTHGSGTVGLDVRRSGPSVVVEVTDEGDGVPDVLAPHIFERAVGSSGSGLGLALARDLAETEGGRLELASARPPVFALFLSAAPIR